MAPKSSFSSRRQPRGLGFVEFENLDDAELCKEELDGKMIEGMEVKIVFAERGRKLPEHFVQQEGERLLSWLKIT